MFPTMRDLALLRTIAVGVLRGYAAYRVVLVVGTSLMAIIERARQDSPAQPAGRLGEILYLAPQIITTCLICGLIWGLSRTLANWLVPMPQQSGLASDVVSPDASARAVHTRARFIARLCVLAGSRVLALYFVLAYAMAIVREIFNAVSPSQFQAPTSLGTVGPLVLGVAMAGALWYLSPLIARAACPMPGPDTLSAPARPG